MFHCQALFCLIFYILLFKIIGFICNQRDTIISREGTFLKHLISSMLYLRLTNPPATYKLAGVPKWWNLVDTPS
jgi:hypothetical protein